MVAGNLALGPVEARILGCLLEKQRTTPDAYPLSLNALRLACNQSTNRDPVVDYDDATIRAGLHRLERGGLVRLASGAGSRASKFRHLLAGALPMDDAEQAVMCVLLLRGAQTPGELKQRTERMHAFASLADVHAALDALIDRELVRRHERRPGQKEDRYSHLLAEDEEETRDAAGPVDLDGGAANRTGGEAAGHPATAPADLDDRAHGGDLAAQLAALAERVAVLESELAALRAGRAQNGAASAEGAEDEPAAHASGEQGTSPSGPLD
jgi:uncharacterized protein YceH (UPF0502 family)